MRAPGTPSVDQLLVLLTVVEEGSFTGAARRLRRATSAISYAIDALEAQLGLPPFLIAVKVHHGLREVDLGEAGRKAKASGLPARLPTIRILGSSACR
jgi:hypothetical protein